VNGTIGSRSVDVFLTHDSDGNWSLNGTSLPHSAGLDLDLGFTPATNLFPIRRLALQVGASSDAPSAWLDDDAVSISRLEQRYERRTETSYWYESVQGKYADLLDVAPEGFVRRYPGLWEAEPT
jgi:uncharacterized protein